MGKARRYEINDRSSSSFQQEVAAEETEGI
jgi:hypothetical protein